MSSAASPSIYLILDASLIIFCTLSITPLVSSLFGLPPLLLHVLSDSESLFQFWFPWSQLHILWQSQLLAWCYFLVHAPYVLLMSAQKRPSLVPPLLTLRVCCHSHQESFCWSVPYPHSYHPLASWDLLIVLPLLHCVFCNSQRTETGYVLSALDSASQWLHLHIAVVVVKLLRSLTPFRHWNCRCLET